RVMRDELSDYEWVAIRPLLPNKPRSVRRVDDRPVLNGIFWVLRSGHGAICLRASAPIRPATIASFAGEGRACGIKSWMHWPPLVRAPCCPVTRILARAGVCELIAVPAGEDAAA